MTGEYGYIGPQDASSARRSEWIQGRTVMTATGPWDFASGAVGRDRRREWIRPPGPHLCTKDRVGNSREPRGKKGVPLRGKMVVPGNSCPEGDRTIHKLDLT